MSRSGYTDDCGDEWSLIRWRGAVASGIRGKRGQAFLKELLVALDSLPEKRLIKNSLKNAEGEFCTLGTVGRARGIDMTEVDPEDHDSVAGLFAISHALACEIMFLNDEAFWNETPEVRWQRMREWVVSNIRREP